MFFVHSEIEMQKKKKKTQKSMTDDARKTLPWSSIINKDCGVRLQSSGLEANVIKQNVFTKFLQHKTNILKQKKQCTRWNTKALVCFTINND